MEANCFTILWWFLPYIDMNQPWVYMCPPPWKPLLPPSPLHPSRMSQSTISECPASCIKFALVIYFNMVIYMSLCYFLISFCAHLLPHSPKVCSLHLCLFFCLAYRVVVIAFLNTSVHVCVYLSYRGIPCFIAFLFLFFADAAVFTN